MPRSLCFTSSALFLLCGSSINGFIPPRQPQTGPRPSLFLSSENPIGDELPAAPPAASASTQALEDVILSASTASVALMIPQETKRVLIEELGYRRAVVERLKFDIAPVLVERRVRCPDDGTIPESWCRSEAELEQENSMLQKLKNESKYPLKVPLLGVSLVLFGKGFSDAIITLIKVNTSFPGASLTEEFLGVPVLLIDGVCVLAGAISGWWTWNTMK